MQMPSGEEIVDRLTDQEVLGLLDVVAAEFAAASTPDTEAEQLSALAAVLPDAAPTVAEIDRADDARLADAARTLAVLLHRADDTRTAVEREAAGPPRPENASADILIAAPIVLTACIVVLQVVGHTEFHRDSSGKWSVSHDPARKTPFDDVLKDIAKLLAELFKP